MCRDFLKTMNHLTDEFSHQRLYRICGFLYLLVAHLDNLTFHASVCDDTDAKNADAAVVSHNRLGYCAHTHGVGTQNAEHAILGRCLEGRALSAQIHTVLHLEPLFLGNLIGHSDEFLVISLMHVREAGTSGEVLTT